MLLFSFLSLLSACEPISTDPPPPTEKAPFDCELGILDGDLEFVSLNDQDKAELILGFQGFLFLEFFLQSDYEPDTCNVVLSIDIEGETPAGGSQPGVEFDGTGLSDPVLVFLPTANISLYTGKTAVLAFRVEDATHSCTVTKNVLLVDDDPTIHSGELGDTGG